MTFSKVTGGALLVELAFHDHGRPFAGMGGGTTKCCPTGTCDRGPASGTPQVERTDPRDPERLATTLGTLD
jgi:hypothetical protein